MTFKTTLISGHTKRKPAGWDAMTPQQRYDSGYIQNAFKVFSFRGHWSDEAAQRKAASLGLKYNVEIKRDRIFI